MHTIFKGLLFRLLLFLSLVSVCQVQSLGQDTLIHDVIYKKNIKSVQLFREGWRLGYPVISKGSETHLVLKFDDLTNEIKNYNYRIVHCDSDWRQTNLNENEYIDGMTEDQIMNYDFSFNTYTSYVHYTLKIPNENLSLLYSGNYALIVYEDWDPSRVTFVKRFMVAEKSVSIEANVSRPVLTAWRDIGQQINVEINYGNFPLDNPFGDIRLVILQNGRWDNAIKNLTPLFDRNNVLIYDSQTDIVFEAGNEYRWFDIKSLRYQSPYIKSIEFADNHHLVNLFPDTDRSAGVYLYEEDLNGMFYIEIQEENDNDINADYVDVSFTYPVLQTPEKGDLYVFGQISNWNFSEQNRMVFDPVTSEYSLKMKLKQGMYNYHIVRMEKGEGKADLSYAEGNFYETENNYLILVYQRGMTSRYDRLIGFQTINSLRRN